MQTATHGNGKGLNDLYILPDNPGERDAITRYLDSHNIRFSLETSDTEGQDWYGKQFIEIPFGESLTNVIQQAASEATTASESDDA